LMQNKSLADRKAERAARHRFSMRWAKRRAGICPRVADGLAARSCGKMLHRGRSHTKPRALLESQIPSRARAEIVQLVPDAASLRSSSCNLTCVRARVAFPVTCGIRSLFVL
jgi:hypothetical protein